MTVLVSLYIRFSCRAILGCAQQDFKFYLFLHQNSDYIFFIFLSVWLQLVIKFNILCLRLLTTFLPYKNGLLFFHFKKVKLL